MMSHIGALLLSPFYNTLRIRNRLRAVLENGTQPNLCPNSAGSSALGGRSCTEVEIPEVRKIAFFESAAVG